MDSLPLLLSWQGWVRIKENVLTQVIPMRGQVLGSIQEVGVSACGFEVPILHSTRTSSHVLARHLCSLLHAPSPHVSCSFSNWLAHLLTGILCTVLLYCPLGCANKRPLVCNCLYLLDSFTGSKSRWRWHTRVFLCSLEPQP